MTLRSSIEPLRIKNFRALWTASVFSNVGSFLQAVAASWVMLELTNSPLWVGLMAASSTLPLLFLALPAGALADRIERRKVLLVSQSIMGAAAAGMAALWFSDLITPGRLLGLGLLLGVGLAINLPAWQALVPDLVPRGMVASAVALNSVAFNVARAVGPALGGLLVATAGAGTAFAVNAASYIGIISVLLTFRSGELPDAEPEPVGRAIAVGLRFARFTPPFRRLLMVAAGFAITSSVVQSLLPNVTAEALNGDATLFGLLLGAMGTGALIGAFTRPASMNRFGAAMVPISIVGFGVAGLGVGLSRIPQLSAVAMFVAGLFWVWTLATLNATVQLLAPKWVRGRAMSLYTLSFVGILPLGSIIGGAIGDLIGAASSVTLLSSAGLMLGLLWLRVGVPRLGEVVAQEAPSDWDLEPHDQIIFGGPVMVVNTWVIDHRDLSEFLAVMNDMRMVRMRTGAYRWRLYRNAEDPHRMTELMLLESWDAHIRQHRRIDAAAAGIIRRARSFDRVGGPITRHLIAVDVADPAARPDWDQLVATHDRLHRTDGSIPLDEDSISTR